MFTLKEHLIYYGDHIISRGCFEIWLKSNWGNMFSGSTFDAHEFWSNMRTDIQEDKLQEYVTNHDNRFDNLRACADEAVRLMHYAKDADNILTETTTNKTTDYYAIQEAKKKSVMTFYEYIAFLSKWHSYALLAGFKQ